MIQKMSRYLVLIGLVLSVTLACTAPASESNGGEASTAAGESVYNNNCAGCHGSDGTGSGSNPALAGSDVATGEPGPVIELVLNGQASMPGFRDRLSDEDIAAVISYVRNSWGNEASGVTADDVAAAR